MIEFLTHLMFGIAIGAYIFNSRVRSGVNDIVKKIAVGLYTALANYNNSKQQKPTVKRATTSIPKQENVGYKTNGAVKSLRTATDTGDHLQNVKGLYPCTCGGILEPVKDWPNYYACAKCQSLKTIK